MGSDSENMASPVSADFFENGTNKQFEWVLARYQETLQAKADVKAGKAEALLKLDKWFQNELPKKIKSRGKEAHLTHEELVQTIKWKLARGVFRPRLKDLIQMNTPRVVIQESKKAFRAIFKRNDLESAVGALSNLKGCGPAMASAVLAAGCPELAPFMADECLLSLEDTEGIDYTMKEYMKLVAKTQQCVDRLNEQGGEWTPHKVELAVWTHYVARDLKPEILADMPSRHEPKVDRFSGVIEPASPVSNGEVREGEPAKNGENGEESNGSNVAEEPAPTTFVEEPAPTTFVEEKQPEVAEGAEVAPATNGDTSSGAPIETPASSEVPLASEPTALGSALATALGTSNGTNGVGHEEEAPVVVNNGGYVEETRDVTTPPATK